MLRWKPFLWIRFVGMSQMAWIIMSLEQKEDESDSLRERGRFRGFKVGFQVLMEELDISLIFITTTHYCRNKRHLPRLGQVYELRRAL
jgi:hypothetical protein